jgi:hypothetical protein
MKIDVVRVQFGSDSTNGLVFVNNSFECYSLEDQVREGAKVMGETAIPLGSYEIKFRTVGGFDSKYKKRYGSDWHVGMLELQDVPNFKYILIHTGNTDEHTAGCLLLGETQQDLDKGKDGFVGGSGDAYKKFYPKVRDALVSGEKVMIHYSNINLNEVVTEAVSNISNKSGSEMINAKDVHKKLEGIDGNLKVLTAMMKGRNII